MAKYILAPPFVLLSQIFRRSYFAAPPSLCLCILTIPPIRKRAYV